MCEGQTGPTLVGQKSPWIQKLRSRASEMASKLKVLAAKLDDLGLIPGIHGEQTSQNLP